MYGLNDFPIYHILLLKVVSTIFSWTTKKKKYFFLPIQNPPVRLTPKPNSRREGLGFLMIKTLGEGKLSLCEGGGELGKSYLGCGEEKRDDKKETIASSVRYC